MTVTYQMDWISESLVDVSVASTLTGQIYYHWYLNGKYQGMTLSPNRLIYVDRTLIVDVVDTLDPDFDPEANPPETGQTSRQIWWVRSLTPSVDHYDVQERVDGGAWNKIGAVWADESAWGYSYETGTLVDLADYEWRIIPYDAAGNAGTPIVHGPESSVRTPDPPFFSATFNEGPSTVTFEERV